MTSKEYTMIIELIIFIPLSFISSVITHELAHLVVAIYKGFRITSFKVWPHRNSKFEWLCGSIKYIIIGPIIGDKAVALAPLPKAVLFIAVWIVLSFFHLPLIMFIVFEMVDIVEWFVGYFNKDKDSDGDVYRTLGEING